MALAILGIVVTALPTPHASAPAPLSRRETIGEGSSSSGGGDSGDGDGKAALRQREQREQRRERELQWVLIFFYGGRSSGATWGNHARASGGGRRRCFPELCFEEARSPFRQCCSWLVETALS